MFANIFILLYTTVFIYDCYTIQSKDVRSGLININRQRNKTKFNILSIFTHVSIYHYMVNCVVIYLIEEDMNIANIVVFSMIEKMYDIFGYGSTFFLTFYILYCLPLYLVIVYALLSYITIFLWYS